MQELLQQLELPSAPGDANAAAKEEAGGRPRAVLALQEDSTLNEELTGTGGNPLVETERDRLIRLVPPNATSFDMPRVIGSRNAWKCH